MAEITGRTNPVYKTLNKPLTIMGVERTLFATALFTGAGFQVLFSSFLGAIVIFAILLYFARVAVEQFISTCMVEQNGHDASDLCTAALRKWQPSKPGFNLNRLDVLQFVLSPLGHDPTLQVTCIAAFRRVAAPRVVHREFDSFEMVGEFRQGCRTKADSWISGIDLLD